METICEKVLCTGCGACSNACGKEAIVMKEDFEGFRYPEIDRELCVDCGLCAKTCPVNKEIEKDSKKHSAYACFSKDDHIRDKSSSGGVFSLLAKSVIDRGGAVFGAGFDENFNVRHSCAEKLEELDGLRRSKYVQSDTGKTYNKAKQFLEAGRDVLFSGTPCQIAGLKAYLKKDYDGLLTCDLACSGVPSPKVWRMYLDFLSKKYNSRISSVSFRDKSSGWNRYNMRIGFENGKEYVDMARRETFFIGFGKNIFNRKSCFNCRFRLNNTKADITLADFWGIGTLEDKDFMDNKGVSLLITNTDKGEKAVLGIKEQMLIKPEPLELGEKYNPRLLSSVPEPKGRSRFFADMASGWDFERLRSKYMDNYSIKYKAKCLLKKIMGRA